MKKQHQFYSIVASVIMGVSVHSTGYAQDVVSQVGQETAPSQSFEAPITLNQAPARAASWQGQELALQGRDVVSYFQADAPSEGSEVYSAKWDNTTWHFSSEENLDLFAKNPHKYVPQFGGFCPVALANNHAKIGTSTQYTVENDKLYLNYNRVNRDKFRDKTEEYVLRAQVNF